MIGLPEAIDGISWAFGVLFAVPLIIVAAQALPSARQTIRSETWRKLADGIGAFTSQFGTLVAWISLIMVLVQTIVVLQRYIFGINFIWLQESITYMHGMLFMLAAAYTLHRGGHVVASTFFTGMPRQSGRRSFDIIGIYVFLVPMMILILQMADNYVEISWKVREGSPETSGIQGVYILKSVILVFPVLMLLQAWAIAVKSSLLLSGMIEPDAEEEADSHSSQSAI